MTAWSPDLLDALARTDEISVSSTRPDGTLRPFVIIWGVVADGALHVRSAHGAGNGWYRRLVASGSGAVRVNGREVPITVGVVDAAVQPAVDAAYREKYARYASIVRGITGPAVHDVTLRLDPLDPEEVPA